MVSSRLARATLGALVALVAACGAPRYTAPGTASRAPDVGLRTIGGRTLASSPGRSLYDVITLYWPNVRTPGWAQGRSASALDGVGVYMNGTPAGSLDLLRDVPATRIASVRRLTPVEEYHAFGRQHAAGAIVVEWLR